MNIQFNKNLLNTFLKYFIRGVLLTLPLLLTSYIVSIAINWLDNIIKINIPGLGVIITVAAITLFGYLGTSLIVSSVFVEVEKFVIKLPLVNLIYTSLKELIAAFVGNKKKFNAPVLIKTNLVPSIEQLGFITQSDLASLDMPGKVAVYVPQSYTFSGDLYIVEKEIVEPLSQFSGAEVMQFIISGGVTALRNTGLEKEDLEDREEIS
jgi:uncharacterized membrane protein